jgi:hypothetical protein
MTLNYLNKIKSKSIPSFKFHIKFRDYALTLYDFDNLEKLLRIISLITFKNTILCNRDIILT